MSPRPQGEILSHMMNGEGGKSTAESADSGDDIVISGISGSYPDSDGVYEFRDNLMNKVNLINDDERRWSKETSLAFQYPHATGKVLNLEKFDAGFFRYEHRSAHASDPSQRISLERVYEALFDAGIHPQSLYGTRTGVFGASCISESESHWFFEDPQDRGRAIMNVTKCHQAVRLAYLLGLQGPCALSDTACSSSLFAVDRAVESMRSDQCDTAIVIGVNLLLFPVVSKNFHMLGVLSDDSKCKCFDEAANGYARSEAIVVTILQKARDARRIYAKVVHSKVNCDGYKENGITFPSRNIQLSLMRQVYSECNVDPTTVSYVEAHATGTTVGDPEECNAIDQAFCTGRTTPLLVGSVKSNMGHSETASGLCSVTKAIIAMETGVIPPNINYVTPREDIDAIREGRIKVVTEPTPFPGGRIAVNSFGFGGANAHLLLEQFTKEKKPSVVTEDVVLAVSGRTREAITTILDDVKSRPFDLEFLQLMNDMFTSRPIIGHEYRGFAIYSNKGEKTSACKQITWISSERSDKQLTLVLPGLGENVSPHVRSLVKYSQFATSIDSSCSILRALNFDARAILSKDILFEANILNAIVATVIYQIAIIDCLEFVGAQFNSVLGISIGEISAAYATHVITAQQALGLAYTIGKTIFDSKLTSISSLTIGLNVKKITQNIPNNIEVSSSGVDSTTLVGLPSVIQNFRRQLQKSGIQATLQESSGVGLHSSYVSSIYKALLCNIQQVLPTAVKRKGNWVSTSRRKMCLSEEISLVCSAEFFAHMLTSPLDVEAAVKALPEDNIVLEVNTENEKILRKTSLLISDCSENSLQFLTALGNLYIEGLDINATAFNPRVDYPVSRSTPMISPLIRWDHSADWYTNTHQTPGSAAHAWVLDVSVNINTKEDAYLKGHTIDSRVLYPATGYINLVLNFVAATLSDSFIDRIYVFKNVQFLRATTLSNSAPTIFTISLQKLSHKFEISEGGAIIVTGIIESFSRNQTPQVADIQLLEDGLEKEETPITLTTKDVYKELRLRGYHYSGEFRGLDEVDSSGSFGKLKWGDNLIPFMDTMLQLVIMNQNSRDLYVPVAIGKIVIDYGTTLKTVPTEPTATACVDLNFYRSLNITKAAGIEIWGLRAQQIPRRKANAEPVLEKYSFVPTSLTYPESEENIRRVIRLLVHIALENSQGIKVKTLELADPALPLISTYVADVLFDLPLIQAEVQVSASESSKLVEGLPSNITVIETPVGNESDNILVIGKDLLSRPDVLTSAQSALKDGGFLISRDHPDSIISEGHFSILAQYTTNGEAFTLLRKKRAIPKTIVIRIPSNDDFSWIKILQDSLQSNAARILLLSQNDKNSGILGLVNCLRQESSFEKIRCVFIRDEKAPAFDLDLPFYAEQLSKDLAINIFENGNWGTYRHEALPDLSQVPSRHVFVNNAIQGDISSLKLFQGPLNKALSNGDLKETDLIKVCYAPINFRDVMLSSGKITLPSSLAEANELQIGIEFSGINAKGERIMGLMKRGAMTTAIKDALVTWKVPDDLTLAEAATIPCVYATVYFSIIVKGRARAGDSILIHSGAGGIGLAAINMSLKLGLDVFVTVGTAAKKQYIQTNYPQIPESHFGNSRDTSFLGMVMRETNSRGVDLVLNSLADDKFQTSLKCLAPGGRFLEIGKYDLLKNSTVDLEEFSMGVSFHAIMLDVAMSGSEALRNMISKSIDVCLKSGFIKPLPTTIFDVNEPEAAFRYMASGKHIGKVVMKVQDENDAPKSFNAVPRFFCNPKKAYIIIGGLGGFGLELANWLVSRGASSLVVTSRRGIQDGFQERTVQFWRKTGVNVKVALDDISTEEGVKNLLTNANAMAPVGAIYNLAALLSDAVFENQTEESFKSSFNGKARATGLLDTLSRRLCPQLEQFVVFSSVSCGRGNAGQTNYGMSNSVMERICEQRKQDGFPALAIQWGAIGEVGLVAEMAESNLELVIGGTLQQTVTSCLQAMDIFLVQDAPVVASMVVAEKRCARKAGETMVDAVCAVMGIKDIKTVAPSTHLTELGMDSMTGVEIKQMLERDFEFFLSPQELRGMTFGKLAELDAASRGGAAVQIDADESAFGIGFLLTSTPSEEEVKTPLKTFKTSSSQGQPIIFIPGLDGIVNKFQPLAEGLKFPAISMRYPQNHPKNTSVQQTAKLILDNIPSHIDHKDFKIIGYSMGGTVAVELVALLEKQGHKGHLILIDGAPSMIQALAQIILGTSDPDEVDTKMIMAFQENVLHAPATDDKATYSSFKTRQEKLDFLVSRNPEELAKTGYSTKHLLDNAESVIQRVNNCLFYKRTEQVLKSKITLISPAVETFSAVQDLKLSELTEQEVQTFTVPGNHTTMLDSAEISDVINDAFSN